MRQVLVSSRFEVIIQSRPLAPKCTIARKHANSNLGAVLGMIAFSYLRSAICVVVAAWGLCCAAGAPAAQDIRLATTTSTENSGLLNVILPLFETKYGGKVRVISVGTGAAMKLGENGDADVLLVHDPAGEEQLCIPQCRDFPYPQQSRKMESPVDFSTGRIRQIFRFNLL